MRVSIRSDWITLSDFLPLPKTKPVREYINGKISLKPMSRRLLTWLGTEINFYSLFGNLTKHYPHPKSLSQGGIGTLKAYCMITERDVVV